MLTYSHMNSTYKHPLHSQNNLSIYRIIAKIKIAGLLSLSASLFT